MPGKSGRAYRNLDLGATGQVAVAKPCKLVGYYFYNSASSARFLKIYDKASAPTQADTPLLTLGLPASSGGHLYNSNGILEFAKGLSVRATTAIADSDTGAPSTNDVAINLFWNSTGA